MGPEKNPEKIEKAVPNDAGRLAELAGEIWREHYTPIIGSAQVEYMLKKFQSKEAVREQMEQGFRYYFLRDGGKDAGYLSIRAENGALFLSKFYVAKAFRKRGLARGAIAFLRGLCRREGLSRIWLTVNRRNGGSIAAYRALGFTLLREQKAAIGGGFFMDDFVLQQAVGPAEPTHFGQSSPFGK